MPGDKLPRVHRLAILLAFTSAVWSIVAIAIVRFAV